VISAYKLPVGVEDLPEVLALAPGFQLYRVDPQTGRASDHLFDPRPESERLYWRTLSDLAHAIADLLRRDRVLHLLYFADAATDLVSGFTDNNGPSLNFTSGFDLYLYDSASGKSSLVSGKNGSPSVGGNGATNSGVSDFDGNVIFWTTAASDMISGIVDANGANDVFMRDTKTGTTSLASRRHGSPSLSAGGNSEWVQQSADGRYIVYTSTATNMVPGQVDTEQSQDVFLYDRVANTTTLASHTFGNASTAANFGLGEESISGSGIPIVSSDGRYVAFASSSTDLVAGFVDGNGIGANNNSGTDVYLFDRFTGQNTLVSHKFGTSNVGGNGTSGTFAAFYLYLMAMSDDGRFVTYRSQATDLIAGMTDSNGTGADVYVYDRVTGTNTLVSHAANGGERCSPRPSARPTSPARCSRTCTSGSAPPPSRSSRRS
jgi:hypothetical protein